MRILIVSALPFATSSSTRAFNTYFKNIGRGNIRQIYTNPSKPSFENCDSFFQITDKMIIKNESGVIFTQGKTKLDNGFIKTKKSKVFNFFKKDWALFHLLRKMIWNEKKWFTSKMKSWIADFNPEVVFYHNSNSMFIGKVAKRIAEFCQIPLILEISDDYIFGNKFSLSPLALVYRKMYKNFFIKIANFSSGCFFISERMKEKYDVFNIRNADVIHISSELKTTDCDLLGEANKMIYFGNLGFNRDLSLIKFAKAVGKFGYDIDVYSPLLGNGSSKKISKLKNINFKGFLPYNTLVEKIKKYEYILIAEPFDSKTSKYISLSLSTKVADSLQMNKKIIAFGNNNCGTIDFMKKYGLGLTITNKKDIKNISKETLTSFDWGYSLKNCETIREQKFDLASNAERSYKIFNEAVKGWWENG